MARTPSGPYYYGIANRKGEKDRYVLCIRDQNMKSGYKQIVFHSSKREAGVKAKALYEVYIEKNQAKPATGDDKPETVESACRIFIKRRSEGRQVICQRHSISQVTGRFNNHFIPFFKKALLADVAVEDVTKYRNVLQDKGLADKTVHSTALMRHGSSSTIVLKSAGLITLRLTRHSRWPAPSRRKTAFLETLKTTAGC